jgi:hypothetical protein
LVHAMQVSAHYAVTTDLTPVMGRLQANVHESVFQDFPPLSYVALGDAHCT